MAPSTRHDSFGIGRNDSGSHLYEHVGGQRRATYHLGHLGRRKSSSAILGGHTADDVRHVLTLAATAPGARKGRRTSGDATAASAPVRAAAQPNGKESGHTADEDDA